MSVPITADGSAWSVISQCEIGGNWDIGTGVDYPGRSRFHSRAESTDTVRERSLERQIDMGEAVLQSQGIDTWPTCGSGDSRWNDMTASTKRW
jgi:hypothetical protein